MNEQKLKDAGILIRDRTISNRNGQKRIEYQVVDRGKIVSRHVMFDDARKSAESLLRSEMS